MLTVHVFGEDTLVQVSVFSEKGDLIYTKEQQIQDFQEKQTLICLDKYRNLHCSYGRKDC